METKLETNTHPWPSRHRQGRQELAARRLAGAKRIEAVLKPETATALIALRERTGRTYSVIIEEALLAASKR